VPAVGAFLARDCPVTVPGTSKESCQDASGPVSLASASERRYHGDMFHVVCGVLAVMVWVGFEASQGDVDARLFLKAVWYSIVVAVMMALLWLWRNSPEDGVREGAGWLVGIISAVTVSAYAGRTWGERSRRAREAAREAAEAAKLQAVSDALGRYSRGE
jgi:hypothetical protein